MAAGACSNDDGSPEQRPAGTETDTEAESGDTTTSTRPGGPDDPDTSSETGEPGSTTVSPGDACPLVGMFRACTDDTGNEGRAFCDDFGGLLQWGPCLTSVACELNESDCDGMCLLESATPTWVEIDGGCGGGSTG